MEDKQLYQLLGEDTNGVEKQISALHTGVVDLIANLAAVMPEAEPMFDTLTNNFNQARRELMRENAGAWVYFTGNGPVARSLKKHIALQGWIQQRLYSGNTEGAPAPSEIEAFLLSQLEQFHYQPLGDAEHVNPTNAAVNHILNTLRHGTFSSPQPPLPEIMPNMRALQTGMYGPDGDGQSLTLVLRIAPLASNGVETIFLAAAGQKASMWHFHPQEDQWLMNDFRMTFAGLDDALLAEFAKAVQQASQDILVEEFDFEVEMTALKDKCEGLFNVEKYLPAVHYLPETGEEVFVRKDDESYLRIRFGDYVLVFLNTKGAYPQRTGPILMSYLQDCLHTVSSKSVPAISQRGLMRKAKAACEQLSQLIEDAKPRALMNYRYSYRPLPPARV